MTTLPHRDQDRVLTLYAHYFLAAELMRSNYVKLQTKTRRRGELNQNDAIDKSIYLCTWLGFLRTSCEGFQKLKMRLLLQNERPKEFCELVPKSDEIGKAMKQHADLLRLVRNDVFHLREDVEAVKRFFADRALRLRWAEELHAAFVQFFSDYRVLCEVHYLMNDRVSEIQIVRWGQNMAQTASGHSRSNGKRPRRPELTNWPSGTHKPKNSLSENLLFKVSAHIFNPTGFFAQAKARFLHPISTQFEVCGNRMIPDTLRCTHPKFKSLQVLD